MNLRNRKARMLSLSIAIITFILNLLLVSARFWCVKFTSHIFTASFIAILSYVLQYFMLRQRSRILIIRPYLQDKLINFFYKWLMKNDSKMHITRFISIFTILRWWILKCLSFWFVTLDLWSEKGNRSSFGGKLAFCIYKVYRFVPTFR